MSAGRKQQRVLCLHGSGGSAENFLKQLAPLRNALSASMPLIEWEFEALDAPDGRWWTYPQGERSYTASAYQGDDVSIDAVEAALARNDFVGIIGFSQGAMLAAIVVARALLSEGSEETSLRFAVLSGAAVPKPYEALLQQLADTTGTTLPTLHTLSKMDTMNPPDMGEWVASCFAPSAKVLWHGAGHTIAPEACLSEVVEFVSAATSKKANDVK
eukprot:1626289-Pleurochrysis_carterae.AAC.21